MFYKNIVLVFLVFLASFNPSLAFANNTKTYKLHVDLAPPDARIGSRIFIMNIKKKFAQGIVLQAGQYDLLIAHDEYYRFRQIIDLKGNKTRALRNHSAITHKHHYPLIKFELKGENNSEIHAKVVLQRLPSTIEQLKDITQRILRQGTLDVQEFLNKYYEIAPLAVQDTNKLALNVFLKQAIEQLERIAALYQDIANRKDTIVAAHKAQFNRLAKLQQKTQQEIESAQAEIVKYRRLVEVATAETNQAADLQARRQLESSITMDQSMAQTFELTEQALKANAELQAQLAEQLKLHSDLIAHLLDTLADKAKLTEQTAHLLRVNRNTAAQLNALTNTDTIRQIIQDIAQSERAIQDLMTRIQEVNLQ